MKENEKENKRTIELDNKQNYSLKDKIPSVQINTLRRSLKITKLQEKI